METRYTNPEMILRRDQTLAIPKVRPMITSFISYIMFSHHSPVPESPQMFVRLSADGGSVVVQPKNPKMSIHDVDGHLHSVSK
jgi:hypothetical protein